MNHASSPETANSHSVTEFPRCQHRTRKGRCRELVSDPVTSLCFRHAAEQKKDRDSASVAARLIGNTEEFTSAVTINRSLGELYKLLARDEIAPRRAAVLAYTCNLLLRTLPAIERELLPKEQDNILVWDVESAVAHRAADTERTMYRSLANLYGTGAASIGSDPSSPAALTPEEKS